jgi:hypothetical protein
MWVTNCEDIDDSIYCESNEVDCGGILCGNGIGDECGVCDGDNSTCWDCAGIPNGDALEDNCGTCDSDSTNDCIQDCSGEWGGDTIIDECGVCDGNGMEDFYADWDGDGFGDCSGDVYTVCPNEAESWMSSECDSLGDINGDTILNILDIVLMVNMILDGEYSVISDINEDDELNILDIVTLVNWIMNVIPICQVTGVQLWGEWYDIESTTELTLDGQGLTGSNTKLHSCYLTDRYNIHNPIH